jgi:hypothetical protein
MKGRHVWSLLWGFTIFAIVVLAIIPFKAGPYMACRQQLQYTKGYGIWEYEETTYLSRFNAAVYFSDGVNDLSCDTIGIGIFWLSYGAWSTLVGCLEGAEGNTECPRGYYGVGPYH